MFNADPFDYLSGLGAGIEEMQARDAANQLIAHQALQAGEITRNQYDEFLAMPHAERTKFVAGISAGFVDKWKQGELSLRRVLAGMNPSSWASGIFGEPFRDPKTDGWGARDVLGNFRPFTPAPTPTPTPATPTSSGRSPLDKILATIFGAFGAPSPLASPATPTPMPTPTPTPTPTPQPTPPTRTVLVKWPDGVIQPASTDHLQSLLAQGCTLVL
jgi:hypothetical protein